jgi:hypothetical protein
MAALRRHRDAAGGWEVTRHVTGWVRRRQLPADNIEHFFEGLGGERSVESPIQLPEVSDVEAKFEALAAQWEEETAFVSSLHQLVLHPCYQRIIGLGPNVVPFLVRDLAQNARPWFWALRSITGEDPVTEEIRGSQRQMIKRWIDWGQRKGMLG